MPARIPAATTHRRRGYAFLLERLLPHHLLTAEREARLRRALSSGDRTLLHSESVAALRDLEALGLYEELSSLQPGRTSFRSTATRDRIHLMQPAEAKQQASRPTSTSLSHGAEEAQAGVRRSPGGHAQPGDVTQPSLETTGWDAEASGAAEIDHKSTPSAKSAPGARADAGSVAATDSEAPTETATAGQKTQAGAAPEREKASPSAAGSPVVEQASLAQLEPLLRVVGVGGRLANLAERLRLMVQRVEHLLPGTRVRIWHLEGRASEELGDGSLQLLKHSELDVIPHFREALRLQQIQFATKAPEGASPAHGEIGAAIPLRVEDAAWGLLEVTWPHGSVQHPRAFAPLLTPLGRLVELGIQNQTTLERLVFVDPLTGVYNRGFYERQLTLEMERAHRTSRKFGLLVMDVDNFKAINDRFGHRAGDQVLTRLAQEVRARMRKIDLMFRYGGEEFVFLLPGAEQQEARRTAERLRAVVGETRFDVEGSEEPLAVTVSIGVAVYPDDARTRSGIFKYADAALYRAKQEGKNRVASQ